MAPSKSGTRPVRSLIGLGIVIVAIFGAIAGGVLWGSGTWVPKLALDLEGGTQIILAPVTKDNSTISQDDLNEAISIIRQRVDSSGVSEAEVTSQGNNNIVVSIPGKPSQSTIDLVSQSAVMRFRPVLAVTSGAPATSEPTSTATSEVQTTETTSPTSKPTATSTPTANPTDTATPNPTATESTTPLPDEFKDLGPTDQKWTTFPGVAQDFNTLDCTDKKNLQGGGGDAVDRPLVTCSQDGGTKYLLGPVVIDGVDITNAQSGLRASGGVQTNEWVVNLKFDEKGTAAFSEITRTLAGLEDPANRFAIVLDKLVVSAPSVSQEIPGGSAEIYGSFTQETATTLANQLSFGSLPLTFTTQSQSEISATLGTEQLEKGLLAGLIGLLLVVLYSIIQYRGLAIITVSSLVVAASMTYGLLVLLGWLWGYRLSLPGVAGVIVSIGITVDSFIVYFERIRDEVRDGRSLTQAVDRGWLRARRTIMASDAVNLVAALTLYFLAVSSVQGFAFTLGLTTLVDLAVVFFFTHPMMTLLVKTKFFGEGHKFSGLDPVHLGRPSVYKGRGRIEPSGIPKGSPQSDGLTIAQRRAAEKKADPGTNATIGDV